MIGSLGLQKHKQKPNVFLFLRGKEEKLLPKSELKPIQQTSESAAKQGAKMAAKMVGLDSHSANG